MGLLLLSVVHTSRPEAFQPHHRELLRLLNESLSELGCPGLLFYSLRTLTTMASYLSTDDVVRHGPHRLPSCRIFHTVDMGWSRGLLVRSLGFGWGMRSVPQPVSCPPASGPDVGAQAPHGCEDPDPHR